MDRLFIVNTLRWYLRLPLKWGIFGLTVLIVCFPYPNRLVDHIAHWRDPNALIEPHAPVIELLFQELRANLVFANKTHTFVVLLLYRGVIFFLFVFL